MSSHVVGSDRKEESRPDLILTQDIEKGGNSSPGTIEGINIYS